MSKSGSGVEQIRQLMSMKGSIDELLGGAGEKAQPKASMDDRVNATLNSLSKTIGNLGKLGAVAGLS